MYANQFYVLSTNPVTSEVRIAHDGVWLSRVGAVRNMEQLIARDTMFGFTFAYTIHSLEEVVALEKSGVRIREYWQRY